MALSNEENNVYPCKASILILNNAETDFWYTKTLVLMTTFALKYTFSRDVKHEAIF